MTAQELQTAVTFSIGFCPDLLCYVRLKMIPVDVASDYGYVVFGSHESGSTIVHVLCAGYGHVVGSQQRDAVQNLAARIA